MSVSFEGGLNPAQTTPQKGVPDSVSRDVSWLRATGASFETHPMHHRGRLRKAARGSLEAPYGSPTLVGQHMTMMRVSISAEASDCDTKLFGAISSVTSMRSRRLEATGTPMQTFFFSKTKRLTVF